MAEWLDFERDKIKAAAQVMIAKQGHIAQRTLAKQLYRSLDRSYDAVYFEIRRLCRSGGWWSHLPVGRQI